MRHVEEHGVRIDGALEDGRSSMPMAYVLGSHSYCGPSVISYIHRVEPDGGARRLHWDERDAVPADRRMGGTGGWPYDSRGAR